VAVIARSLQRSGASAATLSLLQDAHRSSTRSVYESHWRCWVQWCSDQGLDPFSPSEIQLANHLAFMSSSLHLSPSALRVRRAAIRTTRRQLGLPALSCSSVVADVIKGAALRAARSPVRVPSWDLFLVLSFLRQAPFEPLDAASWTDLSLKVVFLVALASGRRVSEVHGLSGLPADVAFEADGSMSLSFLPEFLAKNQTPGDPSPVLLIRPLTDILPVGDPDLANCPVRALKVYYAKARSRRSNSLRRLFLPLKPGRKCDIQKGTIARWIVSLVRRAYQYEAKKGGGVLLPPDSIRAHEVRAWASSLAASSSCRIEDLLKAAYWRSSGVFISFYLRDVARRRADNSFGVGSAVVAQHVMSSSRR
jgi:hypothetical protein